MRSYLRSYLLFCQHFHLAPFPVTKHIYLSYLAFLANSLSSYRSVVNYLNISVHVNRSLGSDLTFLRDYDVDLSKRAVRRLLGDCVARKEPITIDILLRVFSLFNSHSSLHVCMRALFLVALFSFLRISNLVPYTRAAIRDPSACHLRLSSVTFTGHGALLRITPRQRVLEIPLLCIPGSPLCPVTALKQYLATIPRQLEAPLFVCASGGIYQPVLAHHYNAFIKASIAAIGLNPVGFSSHSFRRGGATFAFASHAQPPLLKRRVIGKAMLI